MDVVVDIKRVVVDTIVGVVVVDDREIIVVLVWVGVCETNSAYTGADSEMTTDRASAVIPSNAGVVIIASVDAIKDGCVLVVEVVDVVAVVVVVVDVVVDVVVVDVVVVVVVGKMAS